MKYSLYVDGLGDQAFNTIQEVRGYLDSIEAVYTRAEYVESVLDLKYPQIAVSGDTMFEPCEWSFGMIVKFNTYKHCGSVSATDIGTLVVDPVVVYDRCQA